MTRENRFDYIVVGSGSAGCVLAARLTEAPDVRVLLLEAGGVDRHPLMKMPIGFFPMMISLALAGLAVTIMLSGGGDDTSAGRPIPWRAVFLLQHPLTRQARKKTAGCGQA